MKKLGKRFYARDSLEVAPDLLGKLLVSKSCVARITEVEAYRGSDDAASHAFRGPTPRNDVMFGPPGHLYVYFTYGMHFCANVVTSVDGVAQAVLLRAAVPMAGIGVMKRRRGTDDLNKLCSGPARLAQAFGWTRKQNGISLIDGSHTFLADDGFIVDDVHSSPRVGITRAVENPWRFYYSPRG